MSSIDNIFDELKDRLEYIRVSPQGNEAMIHDNIVHPILTSPYLLGWDHLEAISQFQVPLGKELRDSFIWRNAEPISKRPDIILNPLRMNNTFAVIEEKMIKTSMDKLKGYNPQLMEYMQLFEVVWGLLTDGEKWILKRNFETYHEFQNLDELKKEFKDFRYCIGRDSIVQRYNKTNSTDLFKVYLGNTIISSNTFLTSKQIIFSEPQWLIGDVAWVIFQNINEVTDYLINEVKILAEGGIDFILDVNKEINLYLDIIYLIKNNESIVAENDVNNLLVLVNSTINRYYKFCMNLVNYSYFKSGTNEIYTEKDSILNKIHVIRYLLQTSDVLSKTRFVNKRPHK